MDDCLKRTLHFFRKYLLRLDKGKQFDICRWHMYLYTPSSLSDPWGVYCSQEPLSKQPVTVQTDAVWGRGHSLAWRTFTVLRSNTEEFYREDVKIITSSTYNNERMTIVCFHYDANCPTYFLQDLASCSTNYLWNQMLAFDKENDLVAKGSIEKVKNSCSAYRNYRKCIRHPRKACKKGTGEVFNYNINLRKYAMKMNYICRNDHKKEYLDSLSCYQEVLQNETLQECNFVYKDLKPWLKSVSAFQFFCKVTSKETLTMKRHLNTLRGCYHRVFESQCGESAGSLMNNLIALAFQDPAYLRYSYHPDCRLHRKRSRLKVSRKATRPDVRAGPSTSPSDAGIKKISVSTSRSASRKCDMSLFMAMCLWILSVQLS
ncbi:hypothetical protein LSH36_193g03030 [Paralvinella palmiformis]|uniref:Uncharacterized protein n=1 Tax=Paralvinella palmiformis TaxID=53620 RepID=A0AAD9JQ48_9ANNE|nr:hypothetical protein LSH36_193g03030 [Paralvinella palmiformis]